MTDKKKILLFTDGFPWDPGETPFIYNELKMLSTTYDVDIVARVKKQFRDNDLCVELPQNVNAYKYDILDITRNEKISVLKSVVLSKAWYKEIKDIGLDIKTISDAYTYLTTSICFLNWLKQQFDIEEYDLCYTYWNSYATLALAFYKQKNPNTKIVTRTHGYDLYNERTPYNHQYYKKYVDGQLNRVVFIADSGKEYYQNKFATGDISSTNVKYTTNAIGVLPAGNLPSANVDDEFNLISCSSVIPLKRVNLIVEALSNIEEIRINWTHIGGGSMLSQISEMCREKLDSKVNINYKLMGTMDNRTVRRFYDNHYIDCFITTSSTEGSPVSIQEALAYGIPVIGTNVGEIPKLIKDAGIVIDVNCDVCEIVKAIKKMAEFSAEEYADMRKVAYEKWQASYDATHNAQEFIRILEEVK